MRWWKFMPQNDNFHAFLNFFFFFMHEKLSRRKKQEVTFPLLSTHPPYLTPPTKTAKRKKRGKKTFFGWKMKVKLFLIYIYFRCTLKSCLWRWTEFSVSYVWKAQGKEIKRTRRSKKKIQGKTNEINYGYWVVGLNFPSFFRGRQKFPWICL